MRAPLLSRWLRESSQTVDWMISTSMAARDDGGTCVISIIGIGELHMYTFTSCPFTVVLGLASLR